jgi:hypothetical protein
VQVPVGLPAHVWHWPVQALLQQTPSTQNPDTHSVALEHVTPGPDCFVHVPDAQ